ncbi:MAG: s-methyl-5-thioribose-1-phosphate isomerase, partial [Candidatus Zixiibacteriota bacterium]
MTVIALERAGNCLRLLDQTQLPTKEIYHEYDNYQDIIGAIQRLEVRGAPAIGIAAAYAIAVGVLQTGDFSMPNIELIGLEIKNARPTAVNLSWAVDRVLNKVRRTQPSDLERCLKLLWGEAAAIHEEDRLMCRKIGENGAELIKDGDTILTHCNTGALATGGIGTALAVIYVCHERGMNIKVFADETRPLLQGARLTAWELQKAGVDVTLNTDNMAGMLMKEGKINSVIVGA